MLWHPGSHEPLAGGPWRAGAVRDAITEIVGEAEAAYDPATAAWPVHPRDAEGDELGALRAVYLGAAGVVWALRLLGSASDWRAVARELPERYRAAPDLAGLIPSAAQGHPSLLMGESGVLLVEELVAGSTDRDRLAGLVAANAEAPERELMWGSPGTIAAARVLHERTGERRWLELWEAGADALLAARQPNGLWRQRLYGRGHHFLGPVHGFAGNAAVLAHRRDVGADAVATAARFAEREDGLAQWPPTLEPPSDPAQPRRTQFCHGAPGMVATLAALAPGDDAWTALLAAGGELTWRAGPLAKGAGLCHGTAGNGYAFLALHARTGDELWLERARAFAMHAIEQVRRARGRHGRGRFTLWTGDPGTAVYLRACLLADPRVPFYELF